MKLTPFGRRRVLAEAFAIGFEELSDGRVVWSVLDGPAEGPRAAKRMVPRRATKRQPGGPHKLV